MNPQIKTVPNGPLMVKGLSRLTQSDGTVVETGRLTIALCRCGHSENKPFCDGTHARIGWKSNKLDGRQPRKVDNYVGKEITIHDDRGICSHAGYCTDGLPQVFRMDKEPWIDPNAAAPETIIETIRKCPSGALSYSVDGQLHDIYYNEPEIKITKDGPYYVRGSIQLIDDDRPATKDHYALCRCGHSKNKPFCDGRHWYKEFRDNGTIENL